MTGFQFRLEKVLTWRRTELELAETLFKRQSAMIAELDRKRAEWEAAGIAAELQVRASESLDGSDLAALAAFRRHVRACEQGLAAQRTEAGKELERMQQTMLEARRRCRLLERLRERRLAEWQAETDRELEQIAADSYLAGMARRQT
jgi:flagellar export protein FliJ